MFNLIFNHRYLNEYHLRGFENYKYNSKDTSPLSNYVMHPFWNIAVKLVPMWLAPNVLTFVGFIFTVTNGLLLTIYDPQFYASSDSFPLFPPIPSWVWLLCAILHFLAHTLDGIDGKHARRTKSSGPLGELMDHGMDSWTTFFIPYCIYSIFGRADYSSTPLHMLFIFWSVYITFYLSHWEKYNTGTLYLPWSYDASQIGLCLLYLFIYFQGYKSLKFYIPLVNISSGHFFEYLSYVTGFVLSSPLTFWNVYTCKTSKQPNFWESIRPLISLVVLFLNSVLWAVCSSTNIIEIEPRTFYFMVGAVFSNIACRLIVSQMSSTRCELLNLFLYPLTLSTIISSVWNLGNYELTLLRVNTALYTIMQLHYAICVVRQMCQHFGIYCFFLGRPESIKSHEPELESLGFDPLMIMNVNDGVEFSSIQPQKTSMASFDATCASSSTSQLAVSTTIQHQHHEQMASDGNNIIVNNNNRLKSKKRQPKYRATKRPPSERRFQCDQCESRFFTQKDVKRHLVVHTGVRNFACPFCEHRFGRKDHLVRHAKKSHDEDTRSLSRRTAQKVETGCESKISAKKTKRSTPSKLSSSTSQSSDLQHCLTSNLSQANTFPGAASTLSTSFVSNHPTVRNVYDERNNPSTSFDSFDQSLFSTSPSTSLIYSSSLKVTLVDNNCTSTLTASSYTSTRNFSPCFDNDFSSPSSNYGYAGGSVPHTSFDNVFPINQSNVGGNYPSLNPIQAQISGDLNYHQPPPIDNFNGMALENSLHYSLPPSSHVDLNHMSSNVPLNNTNHNVLFKSLTSSSILPHSFGNPCVTEIDYNVINTGRNYQPTNQVDTSNVRLIDAPSKPPQPPSSSTSF